MLARQFFRENALLALGYFLLLQLALVPAILFWPDFRENIPTLTKLVPFVTLQRVMEAIEKGAFWPYFCMQHFFKGCSLFGLAAAAIIGSGLIAREPDQGTAEFLLSRPVTRRRILLTRWAVGGAFVTVPIFLSSLGGLLISPLVDESLPLGPILIGSAYMSLFILMLFTFTVWMSAGFDHQMRAGTILIGFMLLQFSFYIMKVLNRYSLFYPVDVDHLLPIESGAFPWFWSGIFLGVTAVFLGLAVRRFEKRDF
ncbi:MAG: hypothetical protein EYC70_08430 [Planctomycetota bacterium]|nr:MAG: hypothetical protein EYC70_08430 [Planctomycetota bacterium]